MRIMLDTPVKKEKEGFRWWHRENIIKVIQWVTQKRKNQEK